jgi:hypothetical protein
MGRATIGAARSDKADKRSGDHEVDDHKVRLRRRRDAGSRRPGRDRSGGFERGGWTTPLFDTDTATYVNYSLTGQPKTVAGLRPEERGGRGQPKPRRVLPSWTPAHGALVEQSGRNRWQLVANGDAPKTASTNQDHCDRLRPVADRAHGKEGSTVRVRQRASQKDLLIHFFRRLARQRPTSGGYQTGTPASRARLETGRFRRDRRAAARGAIARPRASLAPRALKLPLRS